MSHMSRFKDQIIYDQCSMFKANIWIQTNVESVFSPTQSSAYRFEKRRINNGSN